MAGSEGVEGGATQTPTSLSKEPHSTRQRWDGKKRRLEGWAELSPCGLCATERTTEILKWNLMPQILDCFVKEENVLSVS